MNSGRILYSVGDNDECYTPRIAVLPIVRYLKPEQVVWCPFDTEESEFVKVLRETNSVIHSHISEGKDFYTNEPSQHWDVMISNPPFTNKRRTFECALAFGKPFALIMSNTWLNDAAPKQLFKERQLQLLMFEERIQFNNLKKITFSSSYFCCDFLPQQIVMDSLKAYSKEAA